MRVRAQKDVSGAPDARQLSQNAKSFTSACAETSIALLDAKLLKHKHFLTSECVVIYVFSPAIIFMNIFNDKN